MRIPIITYHAIGDHDSPLWTSVKTFENHLKCFADNGYESITLEDAIDRLKRNKPIPPRFVVFTFDDGYASVSDYAWPRLKHYGFTGTVFLITEYCGRTNYWPGQPRNIPEAPLLSWKQVDKLSKDGCEFGAHTRTHAALPLLDAERAIDQLVFSRNAIRQKTGQQVNSFAYPYGVANAQSKQLVSDYFEGAVGTRLGLATIDDDRFLLPRIDSFYLNEFWIKNLHTPTFQQYINLRQTLRTLKRFVRPDYIPMPLDEVADEVADALI